MITQELLKAIFSYHPDGAFIPLMKKHKFKTSSGLIFGSTSAIGYQRLYIGSQMYYMHRLIYLWHHGELPDLLDHINRKRSDNRIENLRPTDRSKNRINSSIKPTSSGYRGVHRHYNGWKVRIVINGKFTQIGYFKDKKEAAMAYNKAAQEIYGQFAVLNEV